MESNFELINTVIAAVKASARALMLVYKNFPLDISYKKDNSPLTLSDKISHEVLSSLLCETYPVISEENNLPNKLPSKKTFWLIDPLDGTKDFLAQNGQFTINVALIKDFYPVFGVICTPIDGRIFWGGKNLGSWERINNKDRKIQNQFFKNSKSISIARSHFHDHSDIDIFAKENNYSNFIKLGSSLKFIAIVNGKVDIYPRVVGTAEWDTAAGQALIEGNGGCVIDWHNRKRLKYGKTNFRNYRFLALRKEIDPKSIKLIDYEMELL